MAGKGGEKMESAIVVYEVPPCEAPKQLTARFRPLNLKEHFMAFLCANNPSGFLPDLADALPGETIGDLMLLVATHDGVSLSHLKSYARKVKRASCAVIGHSRALDLLSALFGYRDYCEAYREFQKSGWLANRRNRSSIHMKLFAFTSRE
jgi:hypothetical protein